MTSDRSSSASRPWLGRGLAWVAGLCALGVAGMAQARDLNWSIGIDSPGVSVGVSNHRPMVVYPQPVYVHPQPVYQVRPMPGYVQPVVVYPYPPVVVYGPPGYKHKHRHGHRHGNERWERDDDHRRWR